MSTPIITLVILALCILFFLTEWLPTTVTSMIACLLFALTGVCTFSQAFSGFSNSIVILVFCMMVVGDAMFNSGVAQKVGEKVMQIAGHHEKRFILVAGLTSAVMSSFLANTAVIAMFIAIMNSIAKTDKNVNLKNICLATSMGAMFGGSCTLVGSTPQLTVQSILEGSVGQALGMWDYLPVGLALTAIYLAYVLLIGYPLGKKIWSGNDPTPAVDVFSDDVPAQVRLQSGNRRQQIRMAVILAIMVLLFITEWVSNVMTACICAILCVITKCTDEKSIIKNMDWKVLFRLAGCLGIGVAIGNSGCGELVADAFIYVFGKNISPILFLVGSVLLVMIISNFITNSTAVFVVLPPILAICSEFGFNPLAYAIAVCYGANLCFATPLANAQTGMTMIAGYKFSDYFKYNIWLELFVFIGIIIFVPLFWPLVV